MFREKLTTPVVLFGIGGLIGGSSVSLTLTAIVSGNDIKLRALT
jgi:hypothetical protein